MLCGIGAPGTPRFCALKERGWNLCCGTTHDSTTKQPDVVRKRIHFADSAQCNIELSRLADNKCQWISLPQKLARQSGRPDL